MQKMQKLKPILPSLREKKRYVVYQILSDKRIESDPSRLIADEAVKYLGIFDSAKAGVMPIKYDARTQTGVLKVNHNYVDKLKAVLMLVKEINKQSMIIRTIGVSGILKKTTRFVVPKAS
jgi:RNase P/RNase MRP subunit POP5